MNRMIAGLHLALALLFGLAFALFAAMAAMYAANRAVDPAFARDLPRLLRGLGCSGLATVCSLAVWQAARRGSRAWWLGELMLVATLAASVRLLAMSCI